jgi:predicted enzyme related to lactoylglutathione lyase
MSQPTEPSPTAEIPDPAVGAIIWTDLTVPDAAVVRDFYAGVVGWTAHEHPMDGYSDYLMATEDGDPVSGICYRRGPNADAPPVWLIYVRVADLDASLAAVVAGGGTVLDEPRQGFAVITDPAGASLALFDPNHPTAEEGEHEHDGSETETDTGHGHGHGHDDDHGHGHGH